MRSILARLAKEKGHRVRVMGLLSVVEHNFNETAMNARAQASNRLARANRASHGPRVRAKVRVKVTREKSKGKSKGTKGAKGSHKGKTSKTGLSGLESSKSEARKLRIKHRHVPLTLPGTMVGIVTNGTMAGVLMSGWSSVGWHEGWEENV